MILVTHDPIQYIGWGLVFIGTLAACVILWRLGKAVHQLIWWSTTRPPTDPKADDCVILYGGEWAKLRMRRDDGSWDVYVLAFGEMQVLKTVAVKDMRPIR